MNGTTNRRYVRTALSENVIDPYTMQLSYESNQLKDLALSIMKNGYIYTNISVIQ